MEEREYVELQNLLTKLRVVALKELSFNGIDSKYRNQLIKTVRKVDWLRNNVLIKIENESECEEKEKTIWIK